MSRGSRLTQLQYMPYVNYMLYSVSWWHYALFREDTKTTARRLGGPARPHNEQHPCVHFCAARRSQLSIEYWPVSPVDIVLAIFDLINRANRDVDRRSLCAEILHVVLVHCICSVSVRRSAQRRPYIWPILVGLVPQRRSVR